MSSKQFRFPFVDDRPPMTVAISESLNDAHLGFGCYAWISAPVLASFLWRRRDAVSGRRVLEIGAGPALPGILAARCGAASLTLADSVIFHPAAARLALSNARLNGLTDVRTIDVTWGLYGPELIALPRPHLILASDCFYDSERFEDIVATIAYLFEKRDGAGGAADGTSDGVNPETELWMTYQERSAGKSIRALLQKYGLECVDEISWEEFRSSSHEKEGISLDELAKSHHQIVSVWILIIKKSRE